MNILMLTANDPAGMGIAFCNAINEFSPHSCRLITTETRYNFEFDKDIHIPDLQDDEFGEVERLLNWADIYHFHILSDENLRLGPFTVRDYINGKAVLHHHHGHPYFLENADEFREKYNRLNRKYVVSTPNLLHLLPESVWIPNIVPVDSPLYTPLSKGFETDYFRIGHSPTRQDLKRTDIYQRVMDLLMTEYKDIQSELITNMLHTECLKKKRKCHLFFDQIGPSFGVSSLEALSQGVPSIARLDNFNLRMIKDFTGREAIPWLLVEDMETLNDTVEQLYLDRALLTEMRVASRKFIEDCWRERNVLRVLFDVYDSL